MRLLAVSFSLLLAVAPDVIEQQEQHDPWADATVPKLISEARKAHEEPRGWIIGGDALEALARRDWPDRKSVV